MVSKLFNNLHKICHRYELNGNGRKKAFMKVYKKEDLKILDDGKNMEAIR